MEPEDQGALEPTRPNETAESGEVEDGEAIIATSSPNPELPTPTPQSELARLREELVAANDRAVVAHRRALLAEHAGRVVPDLVQGETLEALDASVERALAAYQSVRDATIAEINAAPRVSAGNGARGSPVDLEHMSPLSKIAYGLRRTED